MILAVLGVYLYLDQLIAKELFCLVYIYIYAQLIMPWCSISLGFVSATFARF